MVQFDFQGKRVLVTGGSQGIGLGIARNFSDAGAEVLITGTRERSQDYEEDLSRFTYVRARLGMSEDRAALVAAAGEIDVLVNNAGHGRTDEYTMAGYADVIDVNLNAAVELCYAFHPVLRARGGTIVNLGSCASFIAIGHAPAYTASKAGLMGFTRAVADQWARDGIRVNTLTLSGVERSGEAVERSDLAQLRAVVRRAVAAGCRSGGDHADERGRDPAEDGSVPARRRYRHGAQPAASASTPRAVTSATACSTPSGSRNNALPTTNTSAPARAASPIVPAAIPPSTSIWTSSPRRSMSPRSSVTLPSMDEM